MNQPKIILFRNSGGMIESAIANLTKSNITRAAVLMNGELWEFSEYSKKFIKSRNKKLLDRCIEVYPIGASSEQIRFWVIQNTQNHVKSLGWLGWSAYFLIGRYFGSHRLSKKERLYCFKAIASLLQQVTGVKYPSNVTGEQIKRTLGKPIFIGALKEYLDDAD